VPVAKGRNPQCLEVYGDSESPNTCGEPVGFSIARVLIDRRSEFSDKRFVRDRCGFGVVPSTEVRVE
jgi:hypothetical protein